MKRSLLLFVPLLLASLSASAEFDARKPFTCTAEDGSKVIANDSLIGGAGKGVVGSIESVYSVSAYSNPDHSASVYFNSGSRAAASMYQLKLDTARAQVTTRAEGDKSVDYFFVPSTLVQGLKSGSAVSAKCFQPTN